MLTIHRKHKNKTSSCSKSIHLALKVAVALVADEDGRGVLDVLDAQNPVVDDPGLVKGGAGRLWGCGGG